MSKLNSELKNEALAALQGKWVMAAFITFLYILIVTLSSLVPRINNLVTLLIAFPLTYGFTLIFYRVLQTKKEIELGQFFQGFQDYARVFGTGFLVYLYTFLWLLLFIVPGIIKSYSYALTYYILIDEPELSYNKAIEKSMKMMDGHKMRMFLLHLSFIGWGILSMLTLGIGFLFLSPYMQTTNAAFYEDLKKVWKEREEVIETA